MVEWVRKQRKDENKDRNERKRGCAETIDGEGGLGHSKTKAVNATCTSFSVYDQDKDIVGNGDAQSSPTSTTQMFQGYQTYNKTPNSAAQRNICQQKQQHKKQETTPNYRHASW